MINIIKYLKPKKSREVYQHSEAEIALVKHIFFNPQADEDLIRAQNKAWQEILFGENDVNSEIVK